MATASASATLEAMTSDTPVAEERRRDEPQPAEPRKPLVVAVDMGYGHLRAARPLAEALGTDVLQVDRAPLAGVEEQRLWKRVRFAYEATSRLSQIPLFGRPLRWLLDSVTDIPHLHPYRDLSAPTRGVITLERMIRRNLGQGLIENLRASGAPLLTTFYSPAIVADRAGLKDIFCVVTDTDINRIWVPVEPAKTNITYLVPTPRAARRLQSYGVPRERIELTGFPLPHELLGGPDLPILQRNLAARLVRLDPERQFRHGYREELAHFLGPLPAGEEGRPPLLTFAVGGAGAQAGMADDFLPNLRGAIESGRLRVCLIAGVRRKVSDRFEEAIQRAGLAGAVGHGLEVLKAATLDEYFKRFNALMADTDILWTKPSELAFYSALGIPLVCAWPVGVHERYNRRWVVQSGAGLKMGDPRFASEWLADWLSDGTLAAAAWSGFMRLPKFGLYQILEAVAARSGGARAAAVAG